MDTITVYTTGPACIRCTLTKKLLDEQGISYTEIDIRENEAAREYVVDQAGFTEAPVVEVRRSETLNCPDPSRVDTTTIWSGFRPDLIADLAAGTIHDRTDIASVSSVTPLPV